MPVTGDPLDRAAEAIRDAMDAGGDFANEPVGTAGTAALNALVEVARAARDLTFELDDAIKAAVNEDWSQDDYDRWDAARARGEAALTRLDKEQP